MSLSWKSEAARRDSCQSFRTDYENEVDDDSDEDEMEIVKPSGVCGRQQRMLSTQLTLIWWRD